jgi:epidermal growth factor receptor substrate 15
MFISDTASTTTPMAASVPSTIGATAGGIFDAIAPAKTPEVEAPLSESTDKHGFEDLDDDFEGLEDAKEGSADDDFANISRSGLDDFNAVFDSSPPASQATKSESVNVPFGGEGSFDFASLSSTSAAGSTAAGATSGASQGATSQPAKVGDLPDWEALFASLDDGPAATPAAAATTTTTTSGNGTTKEADRPGPPGRALTEDGLHDDPILKNLTSMGYSRADAVNALEKYDYNLERVC